MTSTGPTLLLERRLTALKHLAGGRSIEFVADALKMNVDDVTVFAENHGWPDRDRLRYAVDEAQAEVERRRVAAIPPAPHRPSARPATGGNVGTALPSPPVADGVHGLLARADKLTDLPGTKRIATAAKRVRDAVAALDAALTDLEARKQAAAKAAAEKAQLRDKAARLERELAAIKEQLRTAAGAHNAAAQGRSAGNRAAQGEAARARAAHVRDVLDQLGVTAADVRAWASSNGVDCPRVGALPIAVVDAFRKASPS